MFRPHGSLRKFSGAYNLGSANFINKLAKRHPKASRCFFCWLDQYFTEIAWDKHFIYQANGPKKKLPLGWNELPFEMQIGVLITFFEVMVVDSTEPDFFNCVPIKELLNNFDIYANWAFSKLETAIEQDNLLF